MDKRSKGRKLRYLLGYCCWRDGVDEYYERVCELLRSNGHDVKGFCLTINPPGPRMSFNSLNSAWETGSSFLLKHLKNLENSLDDRDVLINWHGANLPPQFVRKLPIHTVFVCNDDPESSYNLSRPAAWAYDQAFSGNASAVNSYLDWGCKHVEFLPMGFAPWDIHPRINKEKLNLDNRDIDVVFFGERISTHRKDRLDRLVRAFPNGFFCGRGWKRGFITKQEMLETYMRSKIGINIHLSTGPINQRLYQLPAHGVMQICDNKDNLHHVFEPGKEIVGFDTIGECIELVHYYLDHENERKKIALAGFRRVHRDYNILTIWNDLENIVEEQFKKNEPYKIGVKHISQHQKNVTHKKRFISNLKKPVAKSTGISINLTKFLLDKIKSDSDVIPNKNDFEDVLNKYYEPPIGKKNNYSIKLGLLMDFQGRYKKYKKACEELDVPYKLIDFVSDRWLSEINRSGCNGFIVHPTHWTTVWKELFDERLRVMNDELGLKIWPRLEDIWIYEGKRRLTYWLDAHDIPHPDTHIFYDRDEARDFLLRAPYPQLYKSHLGSAASGVILLNDYNNGAQLLNTAFNEGVIRKPGDSRDRNWNYVIFQEFIPEVREFRIIKIGESWFGHEKLINPETQFHSGSDLVKWGAPPQKLFDFCHRVAEIGKFATMCFDVFVTKDGELLINELQTVFGSYDPAQMYINGKPGRYLFVDGDWIFEEGLFNRNGGANLRIEEFIKELKSENILKDKLEEMIEC